jgi:ribosomal protein L40E
MSEKRPDTAPCLNCLRDIPSVAVKCRECGYEPRLHLIKYLHVPLDGFLLVSVAAPLGLAVDAGLGVFLGAIGTVLFFCGIVILLLAAPRTLKRQPTTHSSRGW